MSKKKETPLDNELHRSCSLGDVDAVQRILDTGRVHVDCQNEEDGNTPLTIAVAKGNLTCVAILLTEGADPNLPKDHGITPLMVACQTGSRTLAIELIRAGAELDVTNNDGGTALMFACQNGWLQVASHLISRGCNIHKAMQDGTTALFLASQSGHSAIVELLLRECRERGRDVGIFAAAPRKDGAAALFIAAQEGRAGCVEVLLRHGAEVDQARIDDATPLFKACHKGHLKVAEQLLDFGAKVGTLPNGETCLHAAALSGNPRVVEALLRLMPAVDPNVENSDGLTALDLAERAGYSDLVAMLKPLTTKTDEATSKQDSPDTRSSSKRSSLSSTSNKQQTTSASSSSKQQHVRFVIHDSARNWRQWMPQDVDQSSQANGGLHPPQRLQCRMVSTDELRHERRSPVRIIWKNETVEKTNGKTDDRGRHYSLSPTEESVSSCACFPSRNY